jgi:hypothetical protein
VSNPFDSWVKKFHNEQRKDVGKQTDDNQLENVNLANKKDYYQRSYGHDLAK